MKRFYVFALIAALAALAVSEWVGQDSGYILIALGDTSVEMTFWVGLIVLALAFILFYYVSRLLLRILQTMESVLQPKTKGLARARRMDRTSLGLGHFISGDWSKAEKQLLRAADKSEAPMLNYLLAARASHESGDLGKTERYLGLAAEQGAAADVPVKLTRAELQLQTGRAEDALQTLDSLTGRVDKHPVALRLRVEALRSLRDWAPLVEIIPQARRQQVLPAERLDELEYEAGLGLLEAAAKSSSNDSAPLQEQWRNLPPQLRNDNRIAGRYCELLATRSGGDEAESLLRKRLKRTWDQGLVLLYGKVESGKVDRQLLVAEAWLQHHPKDAVLLLSLGRLCLMNRLWGKARDYLEFSVELEASAETCAELGRLYERLGELDKSRQMFERGLTSTSSALPALPLPGSPQEAKSD